MTLLEKLYECLLHDKGRLVYLVNINKNEFKVLNHLYLFLRSEAAF